MMALVVILSQSRTARYSMLAGLAEVVARIVAVYTLVVVWGFTGTVLGHVLAWILADAVLLPLYFHKTRCAERQLQLYHALHTDATYE